jgi:hypothetical protein
MRAWKSGQTAWKSGRWVASLRGQRSPWLIASRAGLSQPRCPGATAATSRGAAAEIENLLRGAGFTHPDTESLPLDPPVVCVLARS